MSDPLSILPRDESGRLIDVTYKWIVHDELTEAVEIGWRPLRPNNGLACHHDHHAVLCWWPEDQGEMRLPG